MSARPLSTPLLRWFGSYSAFAVPQSASPIAFALIALPLTGDPGSGAAMVLAMTIAQVVGAVPLARLGQRFAPMPYLRFLIGLRTAGLVAVALLATLGAPFPLVLTAAAASGLSAGAAYGHLRATLNHLVSAAQLPRALGIAATLNEVAFVASPVIAAGLGGISPALAVWAMVLLGGSPLVLLPSLPTATAPAPDARAAAGRLELTPTILMWLLAGGATTAAIGTIEIGAVSLAVAYGLEPTWGVIFPVAICTASVTGGVWVSIRNRIPRRRTVLAWLVTIGVGLALAGFGGSVTLTIVGAVLGGAVLAPLSTYYSLVLDQLVAPEHRAEVFAMLRTANALGVIMASALIAAGDLSRTFWVVLGVVLAACTAAGAVFTHDYVRVRQRRAALASREAAALAQLEAAASPDGETTTGSIPLTTAELPALTDMAEEFGAADGSTALLTAEIPVVREEQLLERTEEPGMLMTSEIPVVRDPYGMAGEGRALLTSEIPVIRDVPGWGEGTGWGDAPGWNEEPEDPFRMA